MNRLSIRLRLTIGVLLIAIPFLFALTHLILMLMHTRHGHNGGVGQLEQMAESRHLLLTLSAFATVAFGIGAWLVVGRTLSPIRRLAQQARSAEANGDLVQLTPSSGDPEIVELVQTFNDLAQRIRESAESRGRFYAAASHELRTPLQALLGHLELAVSKPRSADESDETIRTALDQTKRLIGLVEGILMLHRIETDRSVPREAQDLDDAIDHCLAEFPGQFERTVDGQMTSILAYPSQLEILLVNLISNAVRHGTADKPIKISSFANPEIKLVISNSIHPDAKLNIEGLNEPFARVKYARGSDSTGNGLGIAICRAICTANGWKLSIQLDEGRFCARVRFS